MKKTTKKPAKKHKRLNLIADLMEKFACGVVNGIELVVSDLTGTRRPRRKYARR